MEGADGDGRPWVGGCGQPGVPVATGHPLLSKVGCLCGAGRARGPGGGGGGCRAGVVALLWFQALPHWSIAALCFLGRPQVLPVSLGSEHMGLLLLEDIRALWWRFWGCPPFPHQEGPPAPHRHRAWGAGSPIYPPAAKRPCSAQAETKAFCASALCVPLPSPPGFCLISPHSSPQHRDAESELEHHGGEWGGEGVKPHMQCSAVV